VEVASHELPGAVIKPKLFKLKQRLSGHLTACSHPSSVTIDWWIKSHVMETNALK
jgi:hypothetical protein